MFTVKDYQTANPKGLTYINICLNEVEAHLQALGYHWFDVPLSVWPNVFQRIGLLSESLVQRYHISIKAFYRWAEENGDICFSDVSYSNFTPKLGENIKAGLHGRFVRSLDALLDLLYQSVEHCVKKDMAAVRTDELIFSFLWMQMTAEEIISLRKENIEFYSKNNTLLLKHPLELKDIHHVIINCFTERRLIASHPRILSALYYVYTNATELLFTTENGTPYKHSSFTKRLSRSFTRINEELGLNLTARSVRSSGLYYRIYKNWEESKMPYVYTEETVDYLFSLLGIPHRNMTAVKQGEFARFLEYAREIQGKNI